MSILDVVSKHYALAKLIHIMKQFNFKIPKKTFTSMFSEVERLIVARYVNVNGDYIEPTNELIQLISCIEGDTCG